MPEKPLKSVAAKYHLTAEQAAEIVCLLDSGYSIPYVMRYHKELAGSMPADGFLELIEERRRTEKLDARRRKILKKLQEREILTPELEEKFNRCTEMRELIDYYVPYRPRKRSRSRQALAQGLRQLAAQVLAQEEFVADMGAAAEPYVSAEQDLPDVDAVLDGVFHIVSDWVAEEKTHRDHQRDVFRKEALLVAQRTGRSVPGRFIREFKPYFEYREKASKVHPYHMLCILRGKRLKVLDYHLEAPTDAMMRAAADLYLPAGASQVDQLKTEVQAILSEQGATGLKGLNSTEFLVACIENSLKDILADVTIREFDKDLCNQAENLALDIIRRNVRSLLMTQPVAKPVLGIHPGYRTGCNLAALDEKGGVLETTTVYPHAPQSELEKAKETLSRLIEQHKVAVVAIGQGTAAEETETLVCALITEKFPDLRYAMVPQVGIDTHVTGRAAKAELPQIEPAERAAVAVARRVQDPLAEFVKVNPRDLCPQPYADDVNGGVLKKMLDRTIEECVCEVGADANQAHLQMLRHISGLGPERAQELIDLREKSGPIKNRQALRSLPKMDDEAFERAAGFIKVAGSDNPLDVTRIHPKHYPVAEAICAQLGMTLADLAGAEGRERFRIQAAQLKFAELEKQFGLHYLMLKDIVSEMGNPWPDPRAQGRAPVLRQRRLTLADLQPGEWLDGTVRNIVDFGVFVDVGVGEDGLIHISELSDSYVQSPYDIVSVGDMVHVRVVRVDAEKRRIALSMRSESARRERPPAHPGRGRRHPSEEGRGEHAAEEAAPKRPLTTAQLQKSTIGMESRRVQRASLADAAKAKEHLQGRKEPLPEPAAKAEPQPSEAPAPSPQEQAIGTSPAQQAEPTEPDIGTSPEPAAEPKPEQPKPPISGLLAKLDFANIERRGKDRK